MDKHYLMLTRNMRFWFCVFFVALCMPSTFLGQKLYDFDALSIEDGLTSGRANVIIQDSHGYMWIGTWNGLNRYDGYEVKVYKPSFHDSTALSNREVVSLLESRDGNIWIGTSDGLNCLDPINDRIRTYEFHNRILALHEDTTGNIWVGTTGKGLYKLNPETGKKMQHFSRDGIRDIYEDTHHNLWLATYSGLISFDPETGSYRRFLPGEKKEMGPGGQVITQIVRGRSGELWIGTWGGGLDKVIPHANRDSIKFIHYQTGNSSISSDVIFRLFYDDYGNLWIGTWNEGLCLLPPGEQKKIPSETRFQNFKSNISNPYSISDNNITALYVDRSGLLWVGSTKIDRTSVVSLGMSRHNTTIIKDGKYVRNTVRSFASEGDNLWVGTYKNLNLYKRKGTRLEFYRGLSDISYRYKGEEYNSYSILALLKGKDGLWAGTDEAGLLFFPGESAYDLKENHFVFFNTGTQPSLPGNKINCIVKSKTNPDWIYIGTQQSGIARIILNGESGVSGIEKYTAKDDGKSLSNNNVRTMLEDDKGRLWVGTQNGLNCFNSQTGTFSSYFYDSSDETTINDNVVNVLFEDSKRNLWLGTNSGLNKIVTNKNTGRVSFKGFPGQDRVGDELVTNILEDSQQNLWVGFYRGMVVFNSKKEKVDSVLLLGEYRRTIVEINSSVSTADGTLFLGGGNGIFAFHPDHLTVGSKPPAVEITDFLVYDKSVKDKNELGIREKGRKIGLGDSLEISYKDDVFTFVFSAMDFKAPQKNTYSYMLEGFDKQWNNVGNRHTATYTDLPSGDYTFKVKAANSDGIWSNRETTIHLRVSTPWWKTTFAYFGYGFIILGCLYFFKVYSIVEAKEKGKMMLERVKHEKENELNDMKSQFFTNITHEFRTPLTLILGPARELGHRPDLPKFAKSQAVLIQRNAQRLLRLVNQLMEFSKIERETIDLILEKCNITGILNELYDSFAGMAASRSIDFKVECADGDIAASVDKDKFEKILYNLVSNAFKYSDDGGTVFVKAQIDENEKLNEALVVEVIDAGHGIAMENQEKVFERFFQVNENHTQSTGGIGLYLSKIFVEQHGGYLELESEPGKGSCFRVILPWKNDLEEAEKDHSDDQENENSLPDKSSRSSDVNAVKTTPEKPLVLVIEDDSELCHFIKNGLSAEFIIKTAFNGAKGLEIAHEFFPDIIVTDIMMPKMDGFQMTKKLRQNVSVSHIPVVFLTAKTMREDEIKGLKLGAVDYIYKPFDLIALKLKIRNILETRRQMQENIRKNQLLQPKEIKLPSLDEKFLLSATKTVNKHLDNTSLDVDLLSKEIGMSSNQTYRKIKALTGQTAKEFIRNQRLKTAANLLLQKRKSISEIIYMVGFSSPSYFTRCFKEYFGCTPSEYIGQNDE